LDALHVVTPGSLMRPGPFASSKDFHDCFTTIYLFPGAEEFAALTRRGFKPDNLPIVFTHNDLHFSNIIISPTGSQIAAIIDVRILSLRVGSGQNVGGWKESGDRCLLTNIRASHEYLEAFRVPLGLSGPSVYCTSCSYSQHSMCDVTAQGD